MKNGKPTVLETLHDNKPGPPSKPIMWDFGYSDDTITLQGRVGPCQTWYQARELARQKVTQLIDSLRIYSP